MKTRLNLAQTEMFTPQEFGGGEAGATYILRCFLFGQPTGCYRLRLTQSVAQIWNGWSESGDRAKAWRRYVEGCFLLAAQQALDRAGNAGERRAAKGRIEELKRLQDRAALLLEADFRQAIHDVRAAVQARWAKAQVDPGAAEKAIVSFTEWLTDGGMRDQEPDATLRSLARDALRPHLPRTEKTPPPAATPPKISRPAKPAKPAKAPR